MTETASRLVVQNLQKSFRKRQVVKNFSLEIESGEVIGLLGPNPRHASGRARTVTPRQARRSSVEPMPCPAPAAHSNVPDVPCPVASSPMPAAGMEMHRANT